jgi:hypothetical protein
MVAATSRNLTQLCRQRAAGVQVCSQAGNKSALSSNNRGQVEKCTVEKRPGTV